MIINHFSISKKNFFISLFILSTLLLMGCSSGATTPSAPSQAATNNNSDVATGEAGTDEQVFTLEELSAFNGKDGNDAYIAVSGVVYDVTNSSMWKSGQHNGFEAGKDLTDAILNQSPHGIQVLDNIPIIGTLSE
jgi:predicted heme/steroid binding protein